MTWNLATPNSVVRISPTTGVFANSNFVGDKEGFVQKMITKWYCHPQNNFGMDSVTHLELAEDLYEFYIRYRQEADKHSTGFGSVLCILYRTGSIKEAETELNSVLKKLTQGRFMMDS
ncbi:hypothetical protein ACP179_01785 (plasmid) [Xenorhabdus stockiae]|uniref:hypothetical protein n=1 Tax=Xenorhabdus stockiae TaxID=351614 RepID=UPI003CFB842E